MVIPSWYVCMYIFIPCNKFLIWWWNNSKTVRYLQMFLTQMLLQHFNLTPKKKPCQKDFYAVISCWYSELMGDDSWGIHLKATAIDWSLRCCHCGKTVWSKNKQTETMSSYPTYPTHQTRPVHLSLTLSVAKFKHCIAMQFNALETSDRGNCCLQKAFFVLFYLES